MVTMVDEGVVFPLRCMVAAVWTVRHVWIFAQWIECSESKPEGPGVWRVWGHNGKEKGNESERVEEHQTSKPNIPKLVKEQAGQHRANNSNCRDDEVSCCQNLTQLKFAHYRPWLGFGEGILTYLDWIILHLSVARNREGREALEDSLQKMLRCQYGPKWPEDSKAM